MNFINKTKKTNEMKKLIFALLLTVTAISFKTNAQVAMTVSDTIVNTGTETATSGAVNSFWQSVAIELTVAKVSGTVAGTCKIQGSLSGVNYFDIADQTLTLADVATNFKIFSVPSVYKYYRCSCTGSGTMAATFTSNIMLKKNI